MTSGRCAISTPASPWDDRTYYQLEKVRAMGANLLNIHHKQEPNPTINYPVLRHVACHCSRSASKAATPTA